MADRTCAHCGKVFTHPSRLKRHAEARQGQCAPAVVKKEERRDLAPEGVANFDDGFEVPVAVILKAAEENPSFIEYMGKDDHGQTHPDSDQLIADIAADLIRRTRETTPGLRNVYVARPDQVLAVADGCWQPRPLFTAGEQLLAALAGNLKLVSRQMSKARAPVVVTGAVAWISYQVEGHPQKYFRLARDRLVETLSGLTPSERPADARTDSPS